MQSIREMPSGELRPAFHGTNAANHSSIFERGLLIPGEGNELRVVHGAAHGKGVYTANVDAAWLSRGFCYNPQMLVCAVLQSSAVRHVGDAMVVGRADHVVPLFEGEGRYFGNSPPASGVVPIPPKLAAATLPAKPVAAPAKDKVEAAA